MSVILMLIKMMICSSFASSFVLQLLFLDWKMQAKSCEKRKGSI